MWVHACHFKYDASVTSVSTRGNYYCPMNLSSNYRPSQGFLNVSFNSAVFFSVLKTQQQFCNVMQLNWTDFICALCIGCLCKQGILLNDLCTFKSEPYIFWCWSLMYYAKNWHAVCNKVCWFHLVNRVRLIVNIKLLTGSVHILYLTQNISLQQA